MSMSLKLFSHTNKKNTLICLTACTKLYVVDLQVICSNNFIPIVLFYI